MSIRIVCGVIRRDMDCPAGLNRQSGRRRLRELAAKASPWCRRLHNYHQSRRFIPMYAAFDQCIACHDQENSPAFNRDTYWKKIQLARLRPVPGGRCAVEDFSIGSPFVIASCSIASNAASVQWMNSLDSAYLQGAVARSQQAIVVIVDDARRDDCRAGRKATQFNLQIWRGRLRCGLIFLNRRKR